MQHQSCLNTDIVFYNNVTAKGQHYLYPHSYPMHYVNQQYLPDEIVGTAFYQPTDIGYERNVQEHMKWLKEE
jgi:putative ATPase